MKACLLLQRRFAYVGHALALELKERHGFTDFCGYVYQRQGYAYLKGQKDINYSTLLLDADIHASYKDEKLDPEYLKKLEDEYGLPSIWPSLQLDRVLMHGQLVHEYPHDRLDYTHEELMRLLQVHAKAVIGMLEKEKPDVVFASVVGAVGGWLLYHVAKKKGIRTIIVHPALIPNRWLLSEDYRTFSFVDDLVKNHADELRASSSFAWAKEYLKNFREAPRPYYSAADPRVQPVTRAQQLKFLNPENSFKWLRTFSDSVKRYYADGERHDYDCVSPWNYLADTLRRKLRNVRGNEDLYDEPVTGERYAFYPLHMEPEIAILLHAPSYTNQIELIHHAARSLPLRHKLYVKEHPLMAEFRPRGFYEELKKNPNVRLIRPNKTSFELIRNAELIFTITGSGAWEGALLGTPSISFGHWFYNTLPCIRYCDNYERLPELVKEQLENPNMDEDRILLQLAAMYQDSAEVDVVKAWTEAKNENERREILRPLADNLAKKLNARSST